MADEFKRKRGRPPLKANKKAPLTEEDRPGFDNHVEVPVDPSQEYVSILIHRQEGESPTVGPIWNGQGKQLWIYRGAKVVVPAWVLGVLEGTRVTTIECDMNTVPPRYYDVVKSRFDWDIIERNLREKDYIAFKESLKAKKHDPWAQTHYSPV